MNFGDEIVLDSDKCDEEFPIAIVSTLFATALSLIMFTAWSVYYLFYSKKSVSYENEMKELDMTSKHLAFQD